MKFAQYFSHLIEKSGLTKTEIASKLGVSLTYVIHVSKGRDLAFTLDRCEHLAKILKLDDAERKKFFELAYEERQTDKNIAFQQAIGSPSLKTVTVKDVKIPVVSMAKGDDASGFEFETIEPHNYEYLDFKNCKAVRIKGNSMAPLAYDNQLVIYSEEAHVKDGDLVFIGLKKKGQFFKRYHKDAKNGIITLLSINVAHHGPITAKTDDIEFMYRVVGVKF